MKNSIHRYIDIHTHDLHKIDNDDIISVSVISINDTKQKLEIPKNDFCLGIHPWHIENLESQSYSFTHFEKIIKIYHTYPNFFALGEMGLDKQCSTPIEKQFNWFRFQLSLATKYKIKLIVIHCVKAYNECYLEIIKSGYQGKIILHSFKPNIEIFNTFSKQFETYISLSSIFLEKKSHLSVIKNIDLSKQFLETDDNYDLCIKDVYDKYSRALDLNSTLINNQFYQNYQKLKKS